MGNLLEQASAWLNSQRQTHMSSRVVYCRGADQQEILVTRGSSRFEVQTAEGNILVVESPDFIVSRAAMDPPPRAGDRILAGAEAFEVAPIGQEPCFRNSDEFGHALRIHTKKVASE